MTRPNASWFLITYLAIGLCVVLIAFLAALTQRLFPSHSEARSDVQDLQRRAALEEVARLPEGFYTGKRIPSHEYAPKAGAVRLMLTAPPETEQRSRDLAMELTNQSDQPVMLLYTYWPYQNLTVTLRDDRGDPVAEVPYYELMSVESKPRALWLNPGETHVEALSLPERKGLARAVYQVEGVFRYQDLVIRSEPADILLKPGERE
jgi:hypothetical protein